ncbi:MAG: M56 family metallopeptidase [Pseudomonadota bacterium]
MNDTSLALVGKIGWTLVHFTWQGLVLGLATALVLSLMRRASPQQRYAVACTGLLLCLAWPAFDLYQRLQAPGPEALSMGFGAASAGTIVPAGLMSALQDKLLWVVGLWAVCCAVLALRMALGLLWVARASQARTGNPQWQARLNHMASAWGITRKVRLCLVDDLASPLTAGWLRPVVLLPASLVSGMPPDLLEALLAHELAHIRRFDYLVNLGQNVIETLLFFHPAVWWISGRIRVEREQIADDLAAHHLNAPRTLALALSELEKHQFGGHHLAMAASGGELSARIRRLMRPAPAHPGWGAAAPLAGLALACAALVAHAQPSAPPTVTTKALAIFKSCAKPQYPLASLRASHTGAVHLRFLVGTDGTVKDSEIARSSGHEALDRSAREAIALCRFTPAMADGKPVQAWTPVKYVWQLHE